jgi:multiple sugar transport system substrate-binding protein
MEVSMYPSHSDRSRPARSFSPTRRGLFRGVTAAGFAVTLPSVLAACGGDGGSASDTVTLGNNSSDPVPKKAMESVMAAAKKDKKLTVDVNTVDHNSFQESINSYLQATPQDVFTWFAGIRMQYFAKKGLIDDITDVWDKVGDNYTKAFKTASTLDGKQYFVPFLYYPWAVFYRKSLFDDNGYEPPKTLDEYESLCKKMKGDGLVPIAMGQKDGWPAMGTFDYFNMRTNGYDFHVDLMAGKESWTDAKVKDAFDNWASILPYTQDKATGRTWQDAVQAVYNMDAGMIVQGSSQVGPQFPAEDQDDVGFFLFPEIDPSIGQTAIEAPIDGFCLSKKAKNAVGGKALLTYLASPDAQAAYLAEDPTFVSTSGDADQSGYTDLQKAAAEAVAAADSISQFLDRDTLPDFAQNVVKRAISDFLNEPGEINSILDDVEKQKQTYDFGT